MVVSERVVIQGLIGEKCRCKDICKVSVRVCV